MACTLSERVAISMIRDTAPRLLVLSSTYPRWKSDPEPGFVHELNRRLGSAFKVTVLCPHAPNAQTHEFMDGVEIVRYRYAPGHLETLVNEGGIGGNLQKSPWKWLLVPSFLLSLTWNLFRLVRSHKPEVIHAHWLIPQGLVLALLRLAGLRLPDYLVTSHGADLFSLRAPIMRALKRLAASQAAEITVVSEAMRTEAQRQLPGFSGIEVSPMGADLVRRFCPDPCVERSQSELLFVGRLVEKKGLRYLIDALPVVLESMPTACLKVVGSGPEGEALRAQVRHLRLESAVQFLGAVPQEDLPTLYRRAALFVAPFIEAASGDQEGLGLVAVEAMGCECPAVVSDVAATRDLPLEGWPRPEPGDAAALASAILDTLRLPQEVRQRIAQVNRQRLLARYDWCSVVTDYSARLTRLAGACPDA